MLKFLDKNQNEVKLAFKKNAFSMAPGHVLVICRHGNQWLLTKHPQRGFEFPGGKVEPGETVEEAGIREVLEETGGTASIKNYLGEYKVFDVKKGPFVKAILFADVTRLENKISYYETDGPVLFDGNLITQLQNNEFSFLMKDEVVARSLRYAKEKNLY